MPSKELQIRKNIVNIFQENPGYSQNDIARCLKINKSTVQSVLSKFKKDLTVERKQGSGRKSGPVDKNKAKKVVDCFTRNPSLSIRDVAKKVKVSKSYVQKIKNYAGLKTYKAVVRPNRSEKQETSVKSRCRKLYDQFLTKYDCLVMDDETYVKADFNQLPGQEFYVAKNKKSIPDKYKKIKLSKFPKRHMVWQAICPCGKRSKAFVASRTINGEVYKKECLQKRLLPFIRQHTSSILFWPDLATCHYSATVMEWYKNNKVTVVPKLANPPNCPELRPIEKYWALVKKNLKKYKTDCKDVKTFKAKWQKASKEVSDYVVQRMMKKVKSKVRNVIHTHKLE